MYNYIREKYMDLKKYIKFGKKDRTIEGSRLEDFWCFLKSVRPKKSVVITGIVLIAGAAVILGVINHVDQNYRILASIEKIPSLQSMYILEMICSNMEMKVFPCCLSQERLCGVRIMK